MLADTSRRRLRVLAGPALAFAVTVASPVVAQQSARDAVALVDASIKAHNAHQPEETLSFYHQDAQFRLSMGRGIVHGVDDIARLENTLMQWPGPPCIPSR
jgi:hypothetical protein